MKLITTFKEWEQNIKGKDVAFFVENNRMYHAFDERLQMCRENAEFVAYMFTPYYERLVGIDSQTAKKLFKKSRNTKEEVLETRGNADVDLIFIPDENQELPYQDETLPYARSLIQKIDAPYELDSPSYIRATYGTSYYLSHMWKTPVKYIALCPYEMLYNLYIKRIMELHGITVEYPCGITEDSIKLKEKEMNYVSKLVPGTKWSIRRVDQPFKYSNGG